MPLRVAVVGSGPAGVYACEALTRHSDEVLVDVLDGLPAPFGLVRYAVAPDHPRTQSISAALATVLQHPAVRFLGNVRVGTDLTMPELHAHYDAILVATGSGTDRRLGIPGEDLPGSVSATDLVAWYCGHPDVSPDRFALDVRDVVVLGAGNVAGDVARMLARSAAELTSTDVPDHVLETFTASTVRDVHLVARRGPAQTRFTTRELRELGELDVADVLVDAADLVLDEATEAVLRTTPAARRNVEVLTTWAGRQPTGNPRRVHLHFLLRPVEILGDTHVTGVRLERTRLDAGGAAAGTGEMVVLPAQMVVRAVGYRSLPLPGLPFDETAGVVPHVEGRVHLDGVVVPGVYVAGWAKRGPSGVIGTNKHDARETVQALLADVPHLPRATERDPSAVLDLLQDKGVRVVSWEGWEAIDREEVARGRRSGRERAKISNRDELLHIGAPPGA